MAVSLVIAGAASKHLLWERNATSPWIAVRWVAIAFLAFDVVYEIRYLEPELERRRGDAAGFAMLHRRSELLMKATLAAAVVALFLS